MQEKIIFVSYILWLIWKLRCSIIFDKVQVRPAEFMYSLNQFISDIVKPLNATSSSQSTLQIQYWCPPSHSFMKVNFDMSFNKDSILIGIGLIMLIIRATSKEKRETSYSVDEEQGEALATLEAIKWAGH